MASGSAVAVELPLGERGALDSILGDIGGVYMDEMLAREFVIATNEMSESLTLYRVDQSLGNRESRRQLVRCAATGCALLSNDVYVEALVRDARARQEQRRRHRRDMRVITGGAHFEYFLGLEKSLLEEAGTDPEMTEAIIDRCREVRKSTRHGKFGATAFSRALEELRLAVCDVLAELRKDTFDQPPEDQLSRPEDQLSRRLAAVLKGVFGCVVVGLDASSLAPTVGLSAAGSAVSIAVGSAIVGQASTDLSGTGCYPRWLLRRFRH
jgi:hypothetical protein